MNHLAIEDIEDCLFLEFIQGAVIRMFIRQLLFLYGWALGISVI